MRILKVANIPDSRNTGMGRVMHSTADELRKMGHAVDLLFSADVRRLRSGRFDRFLFPVVLVRAIRRNIRTRGAYDVVEIHEPSAACYCFLRRAAPDLPPCALISHGLEENFWRHRLDLDRILGQRTSLKSRISVPLTLLPQARYALDHCQQIMCLNSLDERYLREVSRISEDRISRIQHGVEDRFFIRRCDARRAGARLLFVGQWLENKGRRFVVESFQRLKRRHPGLRLSIMGTGIRAEDVFASFPPDLRDSIHVRSHVDDAELVAAYGEHDILVSPSYFEAWGLVLLEAAAAGLAIVASRAGGPSDLFTDGRDALLVERADVGAIESAVSKLIDDPDLCHELGTNARARARQLTWRAAAESHVRAYERAVQLA